MGSEGLLWGRNHGIRFCDRKDCFGGETVARLGRKNWGNGEGFDNKQKPGTRETEHLQNVNVGGFVEERIKSAILEGLKVGACLVTSSRPSLRSLLAVDPSPRCGSGSFK